MFRLLLEDGVIYPQGNGRYGVVTVAETIIGAVEAAIQDYGKFHNIIFDCFPEILGGVNIFNNGEIPKDEAKVIDLAISKLPKSVPLWRVKECWNKILLERYSD